MKTGFKDVYENITSTYKETNVQTFSFQNLEIPLDITFPIKLKSGKILLSAAPVLTVGLKGEAKEVNTTQVGSAAPNEQSLTAPLKFGSADGEIKKTDWGTRFGLGYAFNNGLQINAAYKLGLTNLTNSNSVSYKAHHVMFTVSYFLIGNKKK